MAFLGLIAVFINKRKIYPTWLILVVLIGIAGMYDFYLWEYDYGHDLNPHAPIQVPGMAYQPPLFGGKILLNFYAESYPSWGAFFFGLPMLLSALAFWFKKKVT